MYGKTWNVKVKKLLLYSTYVYCLNRLLFHVQTLSSSWLIPFPFKQKVQGVQKVTVQWKNMDLLVSFSMKNNIEKMHTINKNTKTIRRKIIDKSRHVNCIPPVPPGYFIHSFIHSLTVDLLTLHRRTRLSDRACYSKPGWIIHWWCKTTI